MKKFILFSMLALPLLADDAQPLAATMITAGVGYNSQISAHAIPWVNVMKKDSSMTLAGFTFYTSADVQVTNISAKVLQTVVTAEECPLRTLGEYLVVGGCIAEGAAMNLSNIGNAMGADGVVMYRFGKAQRWSVIARTGILHSALSGSIKPEARIGVNYGFGH